MCRTKCDPINPAPPVIKIVIACMRHMPVELQKYKSFFEQGVSNFLHLQTFVYGRMPTTADLKAKGKQFFDRLFALFVLVCVLSWMVPVLWICNLFVGGGPLFFSHQREGKDRKLFWCYKFRTLPTNAVHPKPGEPLTTPMSGWRTLLRQSGMDELPQVLNILQGEMSVVGPRPHLPAYNAHYQNRVGQEQMDQRHHVRPGLTGLAQIRGYRGETVDPASIHNRINSDLEYIKRQSLLLDLEIIGVSFWLMIRAVVRRIF